MTDSVCVNSLTVPLISKLMVLAAILAMVAFITYVSIKPQEETLCENSNTSKNSLSCDIVDDAVIIFVVSISVFVALYLARIIALRADCSPDMSYYEEYDYEGEDSSDLGSDEYEYAYEYVDEDEEKNSAEEMVNNMLIAVVKEDDAKTKTSKSSSKRKAGPPRSSTRIRSKPKDRAKKGRLFVAQDNKKKSKGGRSSKKKAPTGSNVFGRGARPSSSSSDPFPPSSSSTSSSSS